MIQSGTVVPRSELSVGVDPMLRGSLTAMAAGRVAVIDYFASRGCSVVIGDLTCQLRATPPAIGFTELAAVAGVRLFVESRLIPVVRDARATLRMGGPPFARHLAVELEDPERWLAFLDEPGILAGQQRFRSFFGSRNRERAG